MASLDYTISLKDVGYRTGLEKAKLLGNQFGKEVGGQLASVGKALGGALMGYGLVEFGKSLFEFAGHVRDTADSLDLTTTQVQQLGFAFSQSGASEEQFTKGFATLIQSIASAKSGNVDAIDTFERMGVSWQDLHRLGTYGVFLKLADAVKSNHDPARTFKDLLDIMGKSARQLKPAMMEGADGIQETMGKAVIASEESINAADRAQDRWEQCLRNIKASAMNHLPVMIELLTKAIDVTGSLIEKLAHPKLAWQGITAAARAGAEAGNMTPEQLADYNKPGSNQLQVINPDGSQSPLQETLDASNRNTHSIPLSTPLQMGGGLSIGAMSADLNSLPTSSQSLAIASGLVDGAGMKLGNVTIGKPPTPPERIPTTALLTDQSQLPDELSITKQRATDIYAAAEKGPIALDPREELKRKQQEEIDQILLKNAREMMGTNERIGSIEQEREGRLGKIKDLEVQIGNQQSANIEKTKAAIQEEKKKTAELDGQLNKLYLQAGATRQSDRQDQLETTRENRRAKRGTVGDADDQASLAVRRERRAAARKQAQIDRGKEKEDRLQQARDDQDEADKQGVSVEELRRNRDFDNAFKKKPSLDKPKPDVPAKPADSKADAFGAAVLKLGRVGVLDSILQKIESPLDAS
jgi:hypothetical protein